MTLELIPQLQPIPKAEPLSRWVDLPERPTVNLRPPNRNQPPPVYQAGVRLPPPNLAPRPRASPRLIGPWIVPEVLREVLRNTPYPNQGDFGENSIFAPVLTVSFSQTRFDLGETITFSYTAQAPLLSPNDLIKTFLRGLDSVEFAEVPNSGIITFTADRPVYRIVLRAENRDNTASKTVGRILTQNRPDPDPDPDPNPDPPTDNGIYLEPTTGQVFGLENNQTYELEVRIDSEQSSGNYTVTSVRTFTTNGLTNADLSSIFFQALGGLGGSIFATPGFVGTVISFQFQPGDWFSEGGTDSPSLVRFGVLSASAIVGFVTFAQFAFDFVPIEAPTPGNPGYRYSEKTKEIYNVIRLDQVVDLNPVLNRLDSLLGKVDVVSNVTNQTKTTATEIAKVLGPGIEVEGQSSRISFSEGFGKFTKSAAGRLRTIGNTIGRVLAFIPTAEIANFLNLMVILHNAWMLSTNVLYTLGSVVENGLGLFGLTPKDEEGNPIGIGQFISDNIRELFENLLGEDKVGEITRNWAKFMRVYQAASNIVYSVQSIGFSILNALEVVGSWNAKIGNALKKYGVVFEKAYEWMNPTPNFENRFFVALDKGEEFLDSLDSVISEVRSIGDTAKDFDDQFEALNKAMEEETEGPGVKENIPRKEKQNEEKEQSESPVIEKTDLFNEFEENDASS